MIATIKHRDWLQRDFAIQWVLKYVQRCREETFNYETDWQITGRNIVEPIKQFALLP